MMKTEERVPLQSGGIYHIYNQGNNRENIFLDGRDYNGFLLRFKKYISPVANTFAFTLLPNHFHFLCQIKTYLELNQALPERFPTPIPLIDAADVVFSEEEMEFDRPISRCLSLQFADFFNSYAQSFNRKYNRKGKLFSLPFERILVTDETYFTFLICYIHRNSIHHGFCQHYYEWPYSSYISITTGQSDLIDLPFINEWFGTVDNFIAIHQEERDKFFRKNPNRAGEP